jgi:6-phosphogluconolactonase (cycloisomerase 2 family)
MTFRQSIFLLLCVGMMATLAACGGGGGYGGGGTGPTTYRVGGTVTGLSGSGLVLRDNGGDNLAVSATGSFTFATKLATGAAYSVTILTQPTGPGQTCVVSNSSGTVGSSNVTNVAVACTTNTYTVGGMVTGLTGAGLVLRDNGGDNLNVSTGGAFTFATALPSGGVYNVTVFALPANPNQNCTVTNGTGSGTVTNASVTSVVVVCINVGRFLYAANSGANPGNISAYTIDAHTGALTAVSGSPFAADTLPWGVTVDPSGKFAYVPNLGANHGNGNLSAYTIDSSTGALTAVPGSPFAGGLIPQFVTVHPNGKFAYVTNGLSNNVWAYAIDATSGALTAVLGSPFAAGTANTAPSSVTVDPSGRFAFVPSLDGNTAVGTILAYTIDGTTGALTPVTGSPVAAGTYPNVVTVDPSGKFAYVANIDSADISAYAINASGGALTPIAGSPFAAGGPNTFPRAVTVDPSGKFAYVATGTVASGNIWVYSINQTTGALTAIAGSPFAAGNGAYIVAVDPSGSFAYVGNFYSNNVSAFAINATTGALTPVAGSPFATGGSFQGTMSIVFAFVNLDPSGKFVYVANAGANSVSAFTINLTTGALTPVAGSPFAAGTQPHSVSISK